MKMIANRLFCIFTLLIFLQNANLFAQPGSTENGTRTNRPITFSVGDKVEASYAGSWVRATIKGGYEPNGSKGTYLVAFDGQQGDTRLSAEWVRSLYRPDESVTFKPGDKVLFRRWNDKEYQGEITGTDGKRYQVSYMENGYKRSEWVDEISVKSFGKPQVDKDKEVNKPAIPGQPLKIGDRVMYHQLGFLTKPDYGTIIAIDADSRLYTVKNEKDASLKYSYACYSVLAPDQKPDNAFFVGQWEVRVSGATSTITKGKDMYRLISGGMKLPPLNIYANGTYSWNTGSKIIKGKWIPRLNVPGITLLKGVDGLDWTIFETTEAFATQKTTRDEIRFHHLPSSSGYLVAYRVGANKSCVLAGRKFE